MIGEVLYSDSGLADDRGRDIPGYGIRLYNINQSTKMILFKYCKSERACFKVERRLNSSNNINTSI